MSKKQFEQEEFFEDILNKRQRVYSKLLRAGYRYADPRSCLFCRHKDRATIEDLLECTLLPGSFVNERCICDKWEAEF
jgi:hypothetical protein